MRLCLMGVAASVLLLAATASTWAALAAFVAIGALSSIVNVTVITAFQSAVPATVRGRVMALVVALSTAAVPVGMALGGVLGDTWRDSLPVVLAGSGLAIALLMGLSRAVRGFGGVFDRAGASNHDTTAG